MEDIILVGFGGHAKSVTDTIEKSGKYRIVGYIERDGIGGDIDYRGYRVIGNDCDLQRVYEQGVHNAFVTIGHMGNTAVRQRLYNQLKSIGYQLPCVIDESAVIAADALIGEGTFIGKNAVVNANAEVGRMNIINTGAIVEHDCIIGDFVHLAVGSVACGGDCIGASAFIGANATLIQNVKVGCNAIVGAGAVVLSAVPDNQTVYGVWNGH